MASYLWKKWKKNKKTSKVKIGVLDDKFLKSDEIIFKNVYDQEKNPGSGGSHGTAVSGLIGATPNNKKSIAGVVWNRDLYGFSYESKRERELQKTILEMRFGLVILAESDVKVINASLNMANKRRINELVGIIEEKEGEGTAIPENLENIIQNGNAELKAAAQELLTYWVKEPREFWTPFFKSLGKSLEFLLVATAGNEGFDAVYNSGFNAITDPDVTKNIIVVSSVKNQTEKSNREKYSDVTKIEGKLDYPASYGSRVDILSPGEDVYSTYTADNKSKPLIGTSFAAPIVTGVAGLVWNANPDLTPSEVKEILLQSADRGDLVEYVKAKNQGFPIVNAERAVKMAMGKSVFGKAVLNNSGQKELKGVQITVTTKDGKQINTISEFTNKYGAFEVTDLKEGNYKFHFNKSGYKEAIVDVTVTGKMTQPILVKMEPEKVTDAKSREILKLYKEMNKELVALGNEKGWSPENYDWDQIGVEVRKSRETEVENRLSKLITQNFATVHVFPKLDYLYSDDNAQASYFPSDFEDEIRLGVWHANPFIVEISTVAFSTPSVPGNHFTIRAEWDETDEKWKLSNESRTSVEKLPFDLTKEEVTKYFTKENEGIKGKILTETTEPGPNGKRRLFYLVEQTYPEKTIYVMINADTGESFEVDEESVQEYLGVTVDEPVENSSANEITLSYETIVQDTGEIKGSVPDGGTITIKNGGEININRTGDTTIWYRVLLSGDSVVWEKNDANKGMLKAVKPGKTTMTFMPLGDEEFTYTINIVVE